MSTSKTPDKAGVKQEAASSNARFDRGLIEAVDESLIALQGEGGVAPVYFHIEAISSVKKSEIPQKLKEFSLAIATIFREGAPIVEQLILRKLCEKLGMNCESTKGADFQTAIEAMKQRLSNTSAPDNSGL